MLYLYIIITILLALVAGFLSLPTTMQMGLLGRTAFLMRPVLLPILAGVFPWPVIFSDPKVADYIVNNVAAGVRRFNTIQTWIYRGLDMLFSSRKKTVPYIWKDAGMTPLEVSAIQAEIYLIHNPVEEVTEWV